MSKTKKTIGAIFFILLGMAIIWWQIYLPIVDAMNHEPTIKYYLAGIVIGPSSFLAGIFVLFTPQDVDFLTGSTNGSKKHEKYGIIFILIFFLVEAAIWYFFDKLIKNYGY